MHCAACIRMMTQSLLRIGMCGWQSRLYRVKNEWFDEMRYVPFEHVRIPVPGNYDEVLKAQFGDYMTPSQVKGGHDYPFYAEMEKELVKQIRAVGFMGSVEEFCEKVSTGELQV